VDLPTHHREDSSWPLPRTLTWPWTGGHATVASVLAATRRNASDHVERPISVMRFRVHREELWPRTRRHRGLPAWSCHPCDKGCVHVRRACVVDRSLTCARPTRSDAEGWCGACPCWSPLSVLICDSPAGRRPGCRLRGVTACAEREQRHLERTEERANEPASQCAVAFLVPDPRTRVSYK
jgi:hypothetical protein